jgi:hypothetical protein
MSTGEEHSALYQSALISTAAPPWRHYPITDFRIHPELIIDLLD